MNEEDMQSSLSDDGVGDHRNDSCLDDNWKNLIM